MKKKRITALLLAFIMAFTLIPTQGVFAVTLNSMETDTLVTASSTQAQTIYGSVKKDLEGYKYEDLLGILNPSSNERNTAQKILKDELDIPQVTDAQIDTRLMERLDMEAAFDQVKEDLDVVMPKIIESSMEAANKGGYSVDPETTIRNNPRQVLLGLTYLYRYYGFSVGDTTAKDIILFHPEKLGLTGTTDALTVLSGLGNIGYNKGNVNVTGYTAAKGSNAAETYEYKLAWATGRDSLIAFLEELAVLGGYSSANEFLHEQSKAVIEESGTGGNFFEKAKNDERLEQFLLPLLNLSSESIYIASTDYTTTVGLTSTYGGAQSQDFTSQIDRVATAQQAFLAFWQRISTTKERLDMNPEIIVFDMLAPAGDGKTADRWSVETGDSADSGVREFITPLGYYCNNRLAEGSIGAEANTQGNTIQLGVYKALTDQGVNTYTHELTHIYDDVVWLNGAGLRNTVGWEIYATGLFEAENNTQTADGGGSSYGPIFNLNTAYELGDKRLQNRSPSRFQKTVDIQEYMQGVMDVVYTLDLIEAEEILKMSDAEKAILFNKVSLVNDADDTNNNPQRKLDSFEGITEAEAAELKTVNDLVDNNIVSGRLTPKGLYTKQTINYNEYLTVPLFEGVYAGLQNDNGAVGSFLFRRYAYELLGEYGWTGGFLPYISNAYDSDKKALNKILDEKYNGSMAEFKKDMFQRRADNLDNLKATTTYANGAAMRAAIGKALQEDLALMKQQSDSGSGYNMYSVKNVQNVKKQIFQEYLLMTDDFRESIYKTSTDPIDLSNASVSLGKSSYDYTGSAITPEPVVTYNGATLTKGTDYTVTYSNNTNVGTADITITGTGNYTGKKTITFRIVKADPTKAARDRLFAKNTKVRAAGLDRYATSIAAANTLKTSLGVQKFDNIIVACGSDYPDALSGSYLAKVKKAPVILVGTTATSENRVRTYIRDNLKPGGTVYILGGTGVVTQRFQNGLSGIKVSRLAGNDRFGTNLAILRAADVTNQELLVCTSNGFADSLSASAAGRPILLVNGNSLSVQQRNYMSTIRPSKIYLIGGEGVVSRQMENVMKGYCSNIKRLGGANRFKTSSLVANEFFPKGSESMVLAYAHDFPDGLSGGPVALSIGAPLILVDNINYADARSFAQKIKTKKVVTLGGAALISDGTVNRIVN